VSKKKKRKAGLQRERNQARNVQYSVPKKNRHHRKPPAGSGGSALVKKKNPKTLPPRGGGLGVYWRRGSLMLNQAATGGATIHNHEQELVTALRKEILGGGPSKRNEKAIRVTVGRKTFKCRLEEKLQEPPKASMAVKTLQN